jgi:hypothetical protein
LEQLVKRHEWEFEYTAAKLADAAEQKRDSHSVKMKWWEAKKAEVIAEVKDTGIEVSESVAASYSNTKASFGPQVMVRADLQQKLTECFSKIKEHDQLTRDYEGWRQVMAANPESRVKLHHDDWLYFFSVH